MKYREPLESGTSQTLLAGTAKVDITPPPGLPMAGFSIFSDDGQGFRSKIMARVFYLKPAVGRPVALVQCDLLSGSVILHHRVAELVAAKTDVEAGGLMISATHTHSAPGNYFENMFYNNKASNRPGFDDRYFEFLSQQIADAVISAYETRKPAKIATGKTVIKGVARNRSLPAYLHNNNIASLDKKPDEREAVNPFLHLVRIDCLDLDGRYKPLGAFTNFSLHPNTNPSELGSVYHGDIFSYSERKVEWKIKRHYSLPWEAVHATANGSHGDNNPDYSEDRVENFQDLEKFGDIIAAGVFDLFVSLDDKLKNDVVIRYRARELDLFTDNAIGDIKIADKPVVGLATLAGARGRGRSTFLSWVPFIAPGWPRWIFTDSQQGHKRHAAGPLQPLIVPKEEFPHILFLQVVQVDDTLLLPLPFEVTYEMGSRIEAHAQTAGRRAGLQGVNQYVVAGVSNGYFGYVTTPEEYSMQYYEGGSNLYGPNTGNFLAAHMEQLVLGMVVDGSGSSLPAEWVFNMEASSRYPEEKPPKGKRASLGVPAYHQKEGREEPYWSFTFYDVPACLIEFHRKLTGVEVSDDGRVWQPLTVDDVEIDDNGNSISITRQDENKEENMATYEVRWYNPCDSGGRFFRFAIYPRGGQGMLYSESFRM
jgi:neutral ceramidase